MAVAEAYKRLSGDEAASSFAGADMKVRLCAEISRYKRQIAGMMKDIKMRADPLGVDRFHRKFWVLDTEPLYVFIQVRALLLICAGLARCKLLFAKDGSVWLFAVGIFLHWPPVAGELVRGAAVICSPLADEMMVAASERNGW